MQLTTEISTSLVAESPPRSNLLMAAALALPGLATSIQASAQSYPDHAVIAYKNVDYLDSQPYQRRMQLRNSLYYFYVPVKEVFAIQGGSSTETLSGASPLFHSTLSGASGTMIHEHRSASDVRLIGFFERASVAVQTATSKENDFISTASTVELRVSSENNNTTLALAASSQNDDISATGFPLLHETRNTRSHLVGVTQVLTPVSVIQSNLTYSEGYGFFSDPYKPLDNRPSTRGQLAWLTRYNRYFPGSESSLHLDYRYYRDNWAVEAHTIDAKYYYPLGNGWLVRPRVRYYTQKAASFYRDVFPPPVFGRFYSADQRLAAFGAVDFGVMLSKEFRDGIAVDIKAERYEQRTGSRLFGDNSTQLQPFYARILSIGLSKKF